MRDLKKHKTTHVDVYCDDCDKRFSAKRNLRRHIKKKHEIQDPFRHGGQGGISYPELRTPKFNLVDEGVFPNKVYLLAVYVNITTHS